MIFYQINYGEYADIITGTSLDTASAAFGYDNRSDGGNVTWNAVSGDLTYNFGDTSTFFYVDSFFINNHNWKSGNIQVNTGSAWSTITSFANQTTSAYYYKHTSTLTGYQVRYVCTDTQDSSTAYAGELIATAERFQLNYNPSKYVPTLSPTVKAKQLYNGLTIANKIADRENVFSAEVGWGYLFGEENTLTNTDLQNITELARENNAFLFWPNGDSEFLNMRTWRKDDLYKCKILGEVKYEFPSPAIAYAIIADYEFIEVK
jgi:hypothetical protein